MQQAIIQIKCPFDGTILSVKNQPGIENKTVTCPICKNSYPFKDYKKVVPGMQQQAPAPGYGGFNPGMHDDGGHTELPTMNQIIGRLNVRETGDVFQLRPGRNIIGRRAQQSQADFMIDTGAGRQMSREHIIIDVKNVPAKGFVHYISLFKEKVNDTFVGNDRLYYGDCLVLAHGDMIKLPDATIKFELPEEDATQLS